LSFRSVCRSRNQLVTLLNTGLAVEISTLSASAIVPVLAAVSLFPVVVAAVAITCRHIFEL